MNAPPLGRLRLFLVVFALTGVPAHGRPNTPRAETLTTLLAKHLRASASPGVRQDQGLTQTIYTIQAGPMTGTLTEWAAHHKSRVEMVLGPLRQVSADDGTTAWQQDATGNVRVIRGTERAEDRAAASISIDSYDPLQAGKGARITLRPKREAGTGNYILDLRPIVGPAQTVYLDAHTFLVRKLVASKGGLVGTILISAYKTISGQKVPARLQITYAGLPLQIQAALVQVKRTVQIDPALFALPRTARDFGFLTASGTGPVVVPFENVAGEIIVPVQINGQTRRFVLDSGAGSSFITGEAAHALGLSSSGSVPALGYGKSVPSKIAAQARLEIPNALWMKGQKLYVLDDPALAQMLAEHGNVAGGFGYDLLARFRVTIDYTHKTLTFRAPEDPLKPAAGTLILPLSLANHVPTVAATLNGRHTGRFLVDTGDSSALHLYARFARTSGVWAQSADAPTQYGSGIGGLVSEQKVARQTLTLGRTTLSNVDASVSRSPGMAQVSLLAGGIGNLTLNRFIVTLDYSNQRLLLEPLSSATVSALPVQTLTPRETPLPAPRTPGGIDPDKIAPVPTTARPILLFFGAPTRHVFRPAGSAVAAVSTDTATQEVLAKHLQALGGAKALSAVTSIRETATVSTGGINGTVVTVYAAPNREYDRSQLGNGILDMAEGFDGKVAWRRDTNGNVRTLGENEVRELKLQLYIDTNSYVLPQFGIPGKVTLRPQRDPQTGDYVLDVLPVGGKSSTLFLDPKTFLIDKERHLDDNVPVITTYSDYRAIEGVQYPFKQHTTSGNSRYDVVGEISKIEPNVVVPLALFRPPVIQTSKAQFLTPGATQATVPFDIDNGEISLPIRINGTPSRVFLDSGASGLALSSRMADLLKLKQQGVLEARGYGGSTDLHPVHIDTFDIPGAIRLSDLAAVSLVLPEGFEQSLGEPLAGFIGYDLLSHFVVRIDYAHRQLTLIAPEAFTPASSDGSSVALNLDNDIPSITAQFDKLPPAQFLLDTGDVSALRLYGPYVSEHRLKQKYPKQIPSAGGGIGGESRSLLTRTQSLTVAGTTLHELPTEFSLDTKGGASQVLAGSLGSQVLSRFVVTFDYPHSRVFFAPTATAAQAFDTRTFGLMVAQASDKTGQPHLVIVNVDADAPASRAGVVLYDQILAVDGQSAAKLDLSRIRQILSPAGGATSHTLDLLSPVRIQRTVTVSLYDPLS